MAETTLADELYREAIEKFTAHGIDVDGEGNGTVAEPRLYQLIRQSGSVTDRRFRWPGERPYSMPRRNWRRSALISGIRIRVLCVMPTGSGSCGTGMASRSFCRPVSSR
jgi:hypothetical protein